MAVKPLCQAKTLTLTHFYVRATHSPGFGRQVSRVNLTYSTVPLDECGAVIVGHRFIRETTPLIAADAGGLPGKEVSSQTIYDLECFGIGLRVGPRVALVDRVELAHAETPS